MSFFYIRIADTYAFPFDPLAPFKTEADKKVLQRFMKGDRLVNWNYTCPVNWYMETGKRGNQELLSGKDCDRDDSPYSDRIVWALVDIGTRAGTSDGVIAPSWAHRDGGLPGKQWFHFDEQKMKAQQARWTEFLDIKAKWDAVEVPFAYNPAALSPKALAVLRLIKRELWSGVSPFPEIHDALKELRLQGLLTLRDNSTLSLVPAAQKIRIPAGPRAKLVSKPTTQQLKLLAAQEAAMASTQVLH
jgi:hypothetical protein